MSYEIRAEYSQRWLFPPSLEDLLEAQHPARFIREIVDQQDLAEEGFRVRESIDGRPSYGCDLLLKVVLYAYLWRIRSFRKMEAACHDHLGLIWLTGNHKPDHNTIWRFWTENRKALRKWFKVTTRIAAEAGLVGLVLHAVDGTKVRAQASKSSVWSRRRLQEVLADLDAVVDEYMEQIERAEQEQGRGSGFELPGDWQEQMLKREEVRELLQQMEIEERNSIAQGEREVRFMGTRNEGSQLAYNAQIVVDEQSGLIVAEDVLAEGTDNHALVPMLDQVRENLGEVAQQSVADAGYFSGEQLEKAKEKGYEVLVSDSEENKDAVKSEYHASRFSYDADKDCCICPQGKELPFDGERRGPRGELLRQYRCRECGDCPVRAHCTSERSGRTIRLGPHHRVIREQRAKRRQPEFRQMLSKRARIAERPFADTKWVMGMSRFTVGGLEAVRTQWSMVCIAFNLRRLYRQWVAGRLALAS